MSYSLNTPCSGCPKYGVCADGEILRGAVNIIHSLMAYDQNTKVSCNKGHHGSGHIEMTCGRKCEYCKEEEETKQ